MATVAMAQVKLASESKRSVVTVQLPAHFKTRIALCVISLCLVSGLAGGGILLDVRASAQITRASDAAADQRRDDRIEYSERQIADNRASIIEMRKDVDEFKQDVASVRGAMWVGGLILGILHIGNLILTLRSGIKRIEKEQHG